MRKTLAVLMLAAGLTFIGAEGSQEGYREATRFQQIGDSRGDYFAEIGMHHNVSTASAAITSGDFNKDGNLDVVVANLDDRGTRLYLFEGDGKGNFKLKTYSK